MHARMHTHTHAHTHTLTQPHTNTTHACVARTTGDPSANALRPHFNVDIHEIWAGVSRAYQGNHPHVHPKSDISGVRSLHTAPFYSSCAVHPPLEHPADLRRRRGKVETVLQAPQLQQLHECIRVLTRANYFSPSTALCCRCCGLPCQNRPEYCGSRTRVAPGRRAELQTSP